jgi:hypothetical protein
MTSYIPSDWIENTGTVPAGVGPDTRLEVEWGDGITQVLDEPNTGVRVDSADLWRNCPVRSLNIIRFRFLETPADRAIRLDPSETGSGFPGMDGK